MKTSLHFERAQSGWIIKTDSGAEITGVDKIDFHIDSFPGSNCGCIEVRFIVDEATMKTVDP